MFKIFSILLFFTMFLSAMSQKELAIAIDHSVRQSVRTQKMVKEALLIDMGIDVKENAKRMKFTCDMLNKDLNAFMGRAKSKIPSIKDREILSKLNRFEEFWREVEKRAKRVYNLQYTKDDIEFLVKNNLEFLRMSRSIVLDLIKKNKDTTKLRLANDIKIAGKQRMLTQMISKDIMSYLSNINKREALKDLSKIKEINRNFKALLNGNKELGCVGVKLSVIVDKLKIAQKKWEEAKPLIAKALKKRDKSVTKDIIARLDSVRVNMSEAVVLYTKSINREKQFIALNSIVNSFYKKLNKVKKLIDLSGKQRMLTQRASKLAIECSYNLESDSCDKVESDRRLYSSVVKLFKLAKEKKSLEPKLFEMVKDEIDSIDNAWRPFSQNLQKITLSDGKNREALEYILNNNIKVLKLSNDLVLEMLKFYKSRLTEVEQKSLRVVNLAGKERMLSQKMTKEYLSYHILKDNASKDKLIKTTKLYSLILNSLINGSNQLKIPKVTNFEIKKQLLKVSKLWAKVKPIYLSPTSTQKELKLVMLVNPILLKEMDKTVKMITKATEY